MKTFEGFLHRLLLNVKNVEIGDRVYLMGSYAGVDLDGKEAIVVDIDENPKNLFHKKLYVVRVQVQVPWFERQVGIPGMFKNVVKTMGIPIDNIRGINKRIYNDEDPYGEEDWGN